jgi:phage terminase large subunit-like protein
MANPVLRWMADSTKVNQDPAGNIKRGKPERGKSGKRIDGVVALIMAKLNRQTCRGYVNTTA